MVGPISALIPMLFVEHLVSYIQPLFQYEWHRGSILDPVSQIVPISSIIKITFPRLYI